ncbi:MAG: alcohol dehydrogenase catalytic domain-containing protein [Bacillota bacterium]
MTAEKMKAAVNVAPGRVEIWEVPIPQPGPGEVLIRQKACSLCTMEQRVFRGSGSYSPYPSCWGHEVSGVVAAVGPGVVSVKTGQHVALGSGIFCGQCYHCARGDDNYCQNARPYLEHAGITGLLGMAEYAVTPAYRAVPVEGDIPFAHSCFAEPVSCVIHSMQKLDIRLGDTVVVIGAGTMGLLNMRIAQLLGARVIVSEPEPGRREKALHLGAQEVIDPQAGAPEKAVKELTNGRGAEVVIVTIGLGDANEQGRKLLGKGGRFMLFASAHPATPLVLDPNDVHKKEHEFIGTEGKAFADFWRAVSILSWRLLDVEPLIQARFPLQCAQDAFECAVTPGSYRVVLEM